mmetsp:Transcript_34090/g.47617  ORF Transcript_34090/g.47617 Transcript_34090/m.47617 type:complete len:127 (-) Transcript_34090:45-425(-)
MVTKLKIKDMLIENESENNSEDSDAVQRINEQRQHLFRSEPWHEIGREGNCIGNQAKNADEESTGNSAYTYERQLSNSFDRWNVIALSGNIGRKNMLRSRKYQGRSRQHSSRGPLGDSLKRDFQQL